MYTIFYYNTLYDITFYYIIHLYNCILFPQARASRKTDRQEVVSQLNQALVKSQDPSLLAAEV